MPKKRHLTHNISKPSSPAHPALSGNSKPVVVQDARTAAGPSAIYSKTFAELSIRTSSTRAALSATDLIPHPLHAAHPSIRELLHIPERPLAVSKPANTWRRGIAGPPPPASWVQGHLARRNQRDSIASTVRNGELAEPLPGLDMPINGSLLDVTFKAIAIRWYDHLEYDQYYLPDLPCRLKEVLLYYIARYNPDIGLTRAGLRMLVCDEDREGETSMPEDLGSIARLDISTSIGRDLSIKDLRNVLSYQGNGASSIDHISQELSGSWDASDLNEDDEESHSSSTIPLFQTPRPQLSQTLTYLSIAYPDPRISTLWKDLLLTLAPHLHSLTHLSLAGWPTPSLTPNAKTAYTLSPSGKVSYGASNYYSAYDADWSEAASIIRRLAKHTLCLQFLNLVDCDPWLDCLAYPEIPWCGAWAGMTTIKWVRDRNISGKSASSTSDFYDRLTLLEKRIRQSIRRSSAGSGTTLDSSAVTRTRTRSERLGFDDGLATDNGKKDSSETAQAYRTRRLEFDYGYLA